MRVSPYILGSGTSAQALKEAWAVLGAAKPEIEVDRPKQLRRGEDLSQLKLDDPFPVLCISTPHALHAQAILSGDQAGFKLVVTEKPACVSLEEVARLKLVDTPVVVCHIYRQMWGIQTIRKMVSAGELGEIIAVEGRYWQSSSAQRASGQLKAGGWKDDPALSGPFDALLDVGVHWVDAALFILDAKPRDTHLWVSNANGGAPHRDTHVQLQMNCSNGGRAFASVSKTVHGAPNHFEVNVLGTKKTASWRFLEPDQIEMGIGNARTLMPRPRGDVGALHPPFHGMGWIEGYVETLNMAIRGEGFPKLAEHLRVVEALLTATVMRSERLC